MAETTKDTAPYRESSIALVWRKYGSATKDDRLKGEEKEGLRDGLRRVE